MNDSAGKARLLLLLAVVVVPGVVIAYLVSRQPGPQVQPTPEPAATRPPPVPGFAATHFRNTGPDAKFIGSPACGECHQANHASYLHTAHSRALADVDPNAEPPNGTFEHKLSGRTFRVYRKDGQLRHEELLKAADGTEIARVDLPVRYLVGSGHFCRSYLAEVDGFLHESPVTWYTSKQKWDVSPGYDFADHWSFERPARAACMVCHAGRVEDNGTAHKLSFPEKAIGCENCHGPGSLHRDLHKSRKLDPGTDDSTIVHPGKLPRALREDVCSACHLSGPAAVLVRGRGIGDFRPGLPLTDFEVHYAFEGGRDKMTVVGHVEQLRQSACYQKSADMTCVTCHDPHQGKKPADAVAFFRQKCLDCHGGRGCSVPAPERLKKQPADNCAACHMPRGDTDIPHVAFTHHHIGKHMPAAPPGPDAVPTLVPVGDVSRLPEPDRVRNLGLAYREVSRNALYYRYALVFEARAIEYLAAAYAAGVRDGVTLAALAELYWMTRDLPRAAKFARDAVEEADTPPAEKGVARMILANYEIQNRDFEAAVVHLDAATKLRRFADDWRLIGACHLDRGDAAAALAPLRQAVAIRPSRNTSQLALAEAYRQLGDARQAELHLSRGRWLQQNKRE